MDIGEVKGQLKTILQNLPPDYSQSGARKMMLAFENYKQITRSLVNNYSFVRSGVQAGFDEIEGAIKTAIIGTPKKEAQLKFGEAKRHMEQVIRHILAIDEQRFTRE